MEPIGQKVLTLTSDELAVASDIDENSLENIKLHRNRNDAFNDTINFIFPDLANNLYKPLY